MAEQIYEVSEEQVLYFRARRGFLAGPGADGPEEAAAAMLGAQSQQEYPAFWALSMRCQGSPTATELKGLLQEEPRSLVRTWGQRDTLHIYDLPDWPWVIPSRRQWASTGRRFGHPDEADLDAAREVLQSSEGPITRLDLHPAVSERLLKEVEPVSIKSGLEPIHFAAGRLLWSLARLGDVCAAQKIGSQQAYVSRHLWYPHLDWSPAAQDAQTTATALARRYLSSYGPATVADLAHHFGANRSVARTWVETLEENQELVAIQCEDRSLMLLAEDLDALLEAAPTGFREWPVRLLPLWDSVLMGHADKSWLMPDESERPLVWRKAAYVTATVLAQGRIVATWKHQIKRKALQVEVQPLSLWRKSKHLGGVRRDARRLARHLETELGEITIV